VIGSEASSGILVAVRDARTPAQRIGDAAEQLVAARLVAAGWTIIARNLRLGRDELDIVATDPAPPASLVVVEVRRRSRRDFGLAEETLDWRKRRALRRGASSLLELATLPDGRPLPSLPLRIDLVAIDPSPRGGLAMRHHRGIRP
jgi:putative endonuclease